MDVLPAQDTTKITLLPRPYSEVVDVEKDHPNMLYVAKDVRGITPYALTFNDVGKSMFNEGGRGGRVVIDSACNTEVVKLD